MKKILLSSIIMLGVCGAANAQTGSKFKKNETSPSTTSAAAPTPQKAAVIAESDAAPVAAPAATATAADKQAAQTVAPVDRTKAKQQAKQAQTPSTTVNAAGVVVTSDEEKIKADKAEKAKAAGEDVKKANQ